MAFSSAASNLVISDTNETFDIFVRDRDSGLTERVNITSTGEQAAGQGGSIAPSISADGRFVAFSSFNTNLVAGDNNGRSDIFVHDRETGMTHRVNVFSSGGQANNHAEHPSISADGRYVMFESKASNLVAADSGFNQDVFLHDRETGNTLRASEFNDGQRYESTAAVVSANGRFVVFHSTVWLQGQRDVYIYDSDSGEIESLIEQLLVHNRNTGVTKRADVSSEGLGATFGADYASISADGRFVSFISYATNLVEGDTNNASGLFVHDRLLNMTERLALSTNYINYAGTNVNARISSDGQFVTFRSNDTDLVANDANDADDIFVVRNTLADDGDDQLSVEKLINNLVRETPSAAAKLVAGTQYRQFYKVTNNSSKRLYQVRVLENGNLLCNFYALAPGQTRQRCNTFENVLQGDQHARVTITAKVSGSTQVLSNKTDAYYTGLVNVTGKLHITHRINNVNADTSSQAPTLSSSQASVSFEIENTGEIELYQVKTYHDPVSPVNSGWLQQCVLGALKPGQVRYCKRDITLTEMGLNQAMGRVQGRDAIISASGVVNASNPTYFIVP